LDDTATRAVTDSLSGVPETASLVSLEASAKGTDIAQVIDMLRGLVVPANRPDTQSIITRARHRHALARAVDALRAAGRLDLASSPELAAEEYRRAADSLGRLTGQVDVEELLDSIFSSFCIGK
ncbi:MAG: tRNA uridine-5-carboxymethylaminomethyl(34) synthesis GTPase MnmE, partial [Pseudomonadota bacterium]|nr:tRNA uridine-5-carboxymethylaminomethyl(34) synthesis GTPase MnmE [Pseudomonadota bacterium]